jgi:DNA helicase IV
VTATRAEIANEQKYFDLAAEARERIRGNLMDAPNHVAGPRAAAGEVSKRIKTELEQIPPADTAVAFGRLDLEDDDTYYIGYHGIADDNRERLVINWRMEFVSRLWALGAKDAVGELRRRRRFTTKRNTIVDIDDDVFAELLERVQELTANEQFGIEDALLDDIDVKRSGEMRDIVRTIHASQHELLHHPLDSLLVIQGGPGTGKSAVALHRVSVLLFNFPEDLAAEDVLVIGPNPTFTGYIKGLLPSLGDQGVLHQDLRGLGPLRSHGREEPIAVTKLKGDGRIAGLLERAIRARIGVASKRDLVLRAGNMNVRLESKEVQRAAHRLLRTGTYSSGRNAMRAWLTEQGKSRTRTNALEVTTESIEAVLERVWPSLTPQQFLWELFGSQNRLRNAAGDAFTVAEVDSLARTTAKRVREESWSDADVPLLDEVDRLINGSGVTYAHVVVDEAQDLSPMQLRSIRARSARGSYTIVGDVAQSTGPWARSTWDDVIEALEQDHAPSRHELKFGYRVPQQIFDLAGRLLPVIAPDVTPPRVVRRGPEEPELVRSANEAAMIDEAVDAAVGYAGRGRFVGIICAPEHHRALADVLKFRGIQYDDADAGRIGQSINLMTAAESKGLEFDAVIVVEPAAIAAHDTGVRELYIALTRATQLMTIVHHMSYELLGLGVDEQGPRPPSIPDELPIDIDGLMPPASPEAPSALFPAMAGDHGAETERVEDGPSRSSDGGRVSRMQDVVISAVAPQLAAEIRENVAAEAWPALLEALRRELGMHPK